MVVRPALQRAPVTRGTLFIERVPSPAKVLLSGQPVGETPWPGQTANETIIVSREHARRRFLGTLRLSRLGGHDLARRFPEQCASTNRNASIDPCYALGMLDQRLLVVVMLLGSSGCGKSLGKVIDENRAALDTQRTRFLAAAAAVTSGPRPDACALPADLVHHETIEVMHESAIEEIDTLDSKTNHITVKLDPHHSDLALALAWSSPKRPAMRGKPFPYSLLGEDAASPGSIESIERAKKLKYVVFTRITERDDTAGVVKAEAVVTSLADAKVLCVVAAEGKADPQNEGRVQELVKVNKKTGEKLGVVRSSVVGDYEDQVTTAVANDLKVKLEKTLGFDAWER